MVYYAAAQESIMSTTQFYRMSVQIKDRTEIRVLRTTVEAFCHRCHKNVRPNLIVSKFVGNLPLSVCPVCSSVIQYPEKEITT